MSLASGWSRGCCKALAALSSTAKKGSGRVPRRSLACASPNQRGGPLARRARPRLKSLKPTSRGSSKRSRSRGRASTTYCLRTATLHLSGSHPAVKCRLPHRRRLKTAGSAPTWPRVSQQAVQRTLRWSPLARTSAQSRVAGGASGPRCCPRS